MKKILIIDDDEGLSKIFKIGLEATGRYSVRTESKGRQGLAAAKAFRPDLILLDIVIPDMEGGEVGSQIKTDKEVGDTPILFLTVAATKEEVEKHGRIIGNYPFAAKPVSPEELIRLIDENVR